MVTSRKSRSRRSDPPILINDNPFLSTHDIADLRDSVRAQNMTLVRVEKVARDLLLVAHDQVRVQQQQLDLQRDLLSETKAQREHSEKILAALLAKL